MAHEHDEKKHNGHHAHEKRPFHKDWRVWTIVVLMLIAMGIYVATNDESVAPGIAPAQQVPAAQ
jgi:hypothetical protein